MPLSITELATSMFKFLQIVYFETRKILYVQKKTRQTLAFQECSEDKVSNELFDETSTL